MIFPLLLSCSLAIPMKLVVVVVVEDGFQFCSRQSRIGQLCVKRQPLAPVYCSSIATGNDRGEKKRQQRKKKLDQR